MAKARILVVEDENIVAMDIAVTLKSLGYAVPAITSSGEEAVKQAGEVHPDLALMDIRLKGDMDGVHAAKEIRARFNIPVVYLTAYADNNTLQRAKITEPYGYILKPFQERELHTSIEIALYKHKMERKLKESETKLSAILNHAPIVMFLVDRERRVREVNRATADFAGRPVQEMIGFRSGKALGCLHSLDDPKGCGFGPSCPCLMTRTVLDTFETGNSHRQVEAKFPFVRGEKQGELIFLVTTTRLDFSEDQMVLVCIEDITERKRAEEALRKAHDELESQVEERTAELTRANEELQAEITQRKQMEEEIRLLLVTTQVISESQDFNAALEHVIGKMCQATDWGFGEAWLPSLDGKVLELSLAWYSTNNSLRKFGQLSEKFTFPPNVGLPGRVWSSQQPEWIPDVSSLPAAVFPRAPIALEIGVKAGFGVPIIADGQVLAVLEFFKLEAQEEDSRLVELVSAVAKQLGLVFQRKRAEEVLRETERGLHNIIESNADGMIIVDKNGIIRFINPAAESLFGRKTDELVGQAFGFPMVADGITELDIVHSGKDNVTAEMRMVETEWKGEASYLASLRDITERKKMQEKLIVTDRLASIGELVSGVAHELNNPLTGVIGFSDLLLAKDIPDDIKEDLSIINSEAKRTAQIVKNLLTFARKPPTASEPVNINKLLKSILALRAHQQRLNNIEVNTKFASDIPEVIINSSDLQQVFINIIINAEYFMAEAHKKGTLTITTECVGPIVKASFADDGPGISPENLGHLFDPFFTTKEVGKGTGLGLSICYGIITEASGRLYVESELGKGATFIVELPAATPSAGGTRNEDS